MYSVFVVCIVTMSASHFTAVRAEQSLASRIYKLDGTARSLCSSRLDDGVCRGDGRCGK